MADKCEFLETCGFFNNYKANSEVVKQGWIQIYCEDKKKSERCERRKILKETGIPPADNMAPTGKML